MKPQARYRTRVYVISALVMSLVSGYILYREIIYLYPTIGPPAAPGPTGSTIKIPDTKRKSDGGGSSGFVSANGPRIEYIKVDPKIHYNALFADQIACTAVANEFYPEGGRYIYIEDCSKRITSRDRVLSLQTIRCENDRKKCEIEVYGKSERLALGHPGWIERHRFYVTFDYDGGANLSVTVIDFEPMVRTTPEFDPVNDSLFEYINRSRDSNIRVFQDRVLQRICQSVRDQFSIEKPPEVLKPW